MDDINRTEPIDVFLLKNKNYKQMKHIYILLFSLTILSCGNKEAQTEAGSQETHDDDISVTIAQFKSEQMEFGILAKRAFNQTVTTTGYIDVPPQNKASVSSFVGGFIKNTPLLIGDIVKKGQLLVTLENTEFIEIQQNYLEVAEKLSYLKSEYKRQQTLFNENISSQKNFLKAESTYKSALAHYNGLKQKLKMLNLDPTVIEQGNISETINLYAPISGSITKVNVSNGTYVSAANEILEIVNLDHVHLELSVFEKDILTIKKDQIINFKVPEASQETFQAEVHLVGTTVDQINRTIKIHGHIEDDEHTNFVTGMFIEAAIIIDSNDRLALPKAAVTELNDDYYALVLESQNDTGYVFERIKLEIGDQTEDYIEILNSDLIKGKQLLTKGTYMLIKGEGGGHSH